MQTRNFPILWFFLYFLLFSLSLSLYPIYPAVTSGKTTDINEKIKNQQVLMEFVFTYYSSRSSDAVTAMCKEALEKIHELYKQINNREHTLSFYSSLLDSSKYRRIYTPVFYYLSEFYGRPLKEKYLLKSLKYSLDDQDRQFALTRLYRFYGQEKINYLELSYLLKLIEIQKVNRDITGLAMSFMDLGEIYEKRRDYLAALENYFEALNYSRKIKEKNSGYIYLNIANVFRILNRKALANLYIKKALDYSRKYRNKDLEVMVLSAWSRLSYEEKDYYNALLYINLSLKSENQRQKYICAMQSLYQKALILLEMEDMEETETGEKKSSTAMELLKAAVNMGLKHKKYDELLPVISEYIEQLLSFDKLPEAARCLEKIDDIYAPYYPYYFFYYYLKALFFEKQGQMESALQFYGKTMERLEKYFSGLHYRQYHLFRQKTEEIYSRAIEFYLNMYDHTEDQVYIKQALYFSEIKNSYIYDLITLKNRTYTHLVEEKEKLEEEFLSLNKKYIHLINNGVNGEQEQEELRLYEEKLESLKRQNEELDAFILESPITYTAYKFKDFNIHSIQQHLNPGQLIIKYAVLKENIYTFCIDHRTIGYWKLTGSTHDILNLVRQLTAPLDDFTEGNVDYLRINYDLQLAHQLYEILVKDIWTFRENIDEIFIIPDRELFKLPFEALVVEFNRQELEPDVVFSEYSSADYLIEKLPVSYSFSLFHFREKRKSPPIKKYKITGFGCPIIGNWSWNNTNSLAAMNNSSQAVSKGITPSPGYQDTKQKRLHGSLGGILPRSYEKSSPELRSQRNLVLFKEIPSSLKELLTIPPIFGKQKSRIFLEGEFSRDLFETYAPQAEILHIATHFINNVHYPQYSALLFSPDRDFGPFYYAHEIFKLDLNNRLVVLSACESSEKHLLGLQGLRGMTASFRHAGVQTMIVSMWPVDEHSSELTPLFYREYNNTANQAGEPFISEALRFAKLKLMKKTIALDNGLKISFSHPFVWANYILYNFK